MLPPEYYSSKSKTIDEVREVRHEEIIDIHEDEEMPLLSSSNSNSRPNSIPIYIHSNNEQVQSVTSSMLNNTNSSTNTNHLFHSSTTTQHNNTTTYSSQNTVASQQHNNTNVIPSPPSTQSSTDASNLKYVCCGKCKQWLSAPLDAVYVFCPGCQSVNNCNLVSNPPPQVCTVHICNTSTCIVTCYTTCVCTI
jgi:hypothetical protein